MNSQNTIEHDGIIEAVKENRVVVALNQVSACSACHAKGVCSLSEGIVKKIDIESPGNHYKVGDPVKIFLSESLGFKALFWGYLLPFLILMATLIIMSLATKNEIISGISAVAMLIPYYGILYLYKDRIRKIFVFKIKS